MTRRNPFKYGTALLAASGMLVAAFALASPVAAGPKPPDLLCGFTANWLCVFPNGKEKTVTGTQCDIAKLERRGATCTIQ